MTQPVDQITQPVDQITQPVDQITQPVDQITQQVDQIIPLGVQDGLGPGQLGPIYQQHVVIEWALGKLGSGQLGPGAQVS